MRKLFFVFVVIVPYLVEAIEVEPGIARFGDKIFVKGDGYKEKERVKIISDDKVFTATATVQGSWTFLFDPQFGGKRVITAKGIEKEETAVFWIRPKIKVSPISGSRGTVLTVEGVGFSQGERIQMGLNRNYKPKFVEASKKGTFSTNYIVENQPAGKGSFYAVGTMYYLDDRKDFEMKANLTLIPSKGEVGSLMTISGTGFAPSPEGLSPGELIVVDFGRYETAASVYTDYYGSFQIPFFVPKEKGGMIGVKVKGESSGIACEASWTVTAKIKELPISCFAGKPIRIEGEGFLEKEKIKIIWNDVTGSRTTKEFIADEKGIIDIEYLVDSQPIGVARMTMLSDRLQIKKEIKIEPCLEVKEIFPKAEGGTITLQGMGFGIEEEMRIDLGSYLYIAKPVTDKRGSFLISFYLPQISGEQRIVVGGRKSYATVIKYIDVK
ncbi:MAG: hypothetical protein QME07_06340 [bacterium]|nr:hypothetical protein [bacterium]